MMVIARAKTARREAFPSRSRSNRSGFLLCKTAAGFPRKTVCPEREAFIACNGLCVPYSFLCSSGFDPHSFLFRSSFAPLSFRACPAFVPYSFRIGAKGMPPRESGRAPLKITSH